MGAGLVLLLLLQGRLRPPDFVTCDRNRLTSFTGPVVQIARRAETTVLRMETDEETKETFTLRHGPEGPASLFFVGGQPFTEDDWKRVTPRARATVWVCATEKSPKVDWERR